MSLASALGAIERRAFGAARSKYKTQAGLVQSRAELEAIAARWTALEERVAGTELFQSVGWARAVYDFEASRGNAAFDPVIATLEDGRRLVAILPLERVRSGARTVLVPLGHAFGQVSDLLMAPEVDARDGMRQLLRTAIDAAPSDAVGFYKVREGSALYRGMPKKNVLTGEVQGAPYVALDAFPDFQSYFQTIRQKTRKNMRNARNRLEREAPLEHRVVTDPAEQRELIARTLAGRAERLKDQGLTSRAFSNGGFLPFCQSLVGRSDVQLMAFSLTHGGKPIAEQWGFVHAGRYYAYVASRDFSNSEESPGKLHLSEIIRACSDHGLIGCDLGVPAMPYKLTWATETVAVRDYALPITPKGWLLIQFWDVWLRPAIKAQVLRMPASWRSRMMRLIGRGR